MTRRYTFALLALLAVVGCTTEDGGLEPSFSTAATCALEPHLRTINVATMSQLQAATLNPRAGDLIVLADGRYGGRLSLGDNPGTASAPVTICGSWNAVVGPTTYNGSANALLIMRAAHWHLVGFRVTGAATGIALVRSPYFQIRNMQVDHVNTGIHAYGFSRQGLIKNTYVHHTGIAYPEKGEAIYVGTSYAGWCTNSNCGPDKTDSVRVLNNRLGPSVPAELLDAKEGTTGGIFEGNVMDGSGMIKSQVWVDAWVEIKGNHWKIRNNRGVKALRDGYQVENSASGWSKGNYFGGNTADVQGPGYGFMMRVNKSTNVVKCGQTVLHAGSGYANVSCTP